MKKPLILSSVLFLLTFTILGCTGAGDVGIEMDSMWADIPKTDNFEYVSPGASFELIPNMMVTLRSAEAVESVATPDVGNPYNEIYSQKGRFLIANLTAWRIGEISSDLPRMILINVLGWDDEILQNKDLIASMETSLGKQFLRPELVEDEKKNFFICFPTEGASLGWIINIYREIDSELYLDMSIDTGK
jgi:hypothetical protein